MEKKVVKGMMRTSQVGSKTRTLGEPFGFSLVEVLVVLVIVGLMATLVVMNIPQQKSDLHVEAGRLVKRLNQTADASLVRRAPMGIRFIDNGYEVVEFSREGRELNTRFTYKPKSITRLSFRSNGQDIDIQKAAKLKKPVIRYDRTGIATPFTLELSTADDQVLIEGLFDGKAYIVQQETLS